MRFSLKWILAAAAYVAIAAAAFSQRAWVYADILWAVSLLAVVFASLVTFLARGKGRVAAGGFLLSSAYYLLCLVLGLLLGSDVVPTTRLLSAVGFKENGPIAYSYYMAAPVTAPQPYSGGPSPVAAVAPIYPSTATLPPVAAAPALTPAPAFVDFASYVRAGNAVGMMAFGLLGCLVGTLAHRSARQDATAMLTK
jgi:hypothetical protein